MCKKYRHKETGAIYHHDLHQELWNDIVRNRCTNKYESAVLFDIHMRRIPFFTADCLACTAVLNVMAVEQDVDVAGADNIEGLHCKHCPLCPDGQQKSEDGSWRECLGGLYRHWSCEDDNTDAQTCIAEKIRDLPVVNSEWEEVAECVN